MALLLTSETIEITKSWWMSESKDVIHVGCDYITLLYKYNICRGPSNSEPTVTLT